MENDSGYIPPPFGRTLPFPELLSQHLHNGTRPEGRPGQAGVRWSLKRFAAAVGVTEQALYNWTSGKGLPNHTSVDSIERTLFGPNPLYAAARQAFRASYELAARKRTAALSYQPLIKPDRFLGQDASFRFLVASLLASSNVTAAVLGPPGVGKTTFIRQVAACLPIAERFAERRWFVNLEAVKSAAALRTAITLAIGLDLEHVTFRDVQERLGRQICLLVLDNLETPWEQDMAAVQECLRQFAAIPSLTMLVSLRGRVAPISPVFGCQIVLDPLALSDAKSLFLDIARGIAADDPYLDLLLHQLHGMPLAVELVAYRSAPFHSCQDVWEEWQRTGLAIATHPDQPDGRYTSVLRSIELSWRSPRLHKEGKELFLMLAHLPGGMAKQDISALMKNDAHEATRQLLATGLAFMKIGDRGDRLDLLPPIRAFARLLPEAEEVGRQLWVNHYLYDYSAIGLKLGEATADFIAVLADEQENLQRSVFVAAQTLLHRAESAASSSDERVRGEARAIIDFMLKEVRSCLECADQAQEKLKSAYQCMLRSQIARANLDPVMILIEELQALQLWHEAVVIFGSSTSRILRLLAIEYSKSV